MDRVPGYEQVGLNRRGPAGVGLAGGPVRLNQISTIEIVKFLNMRL